MPVVDAVPAAVPSPARSRRRWRRVRAGAVAVGALLAGVAGVAACGGDDGAAGPAVSALTVTGAWSRPTPPGATSAVLYLEVVSPADDELLGVSVPAEVAASTSLHRTTVEGATAEMGAMPGMDHGDAAVMTMTEVTAVPLPARRPVVFEPGGLHVMLHGLAAPLVAGAGYDATLRFAGHGPLVVRVVVADRAPAR
ncbi:MAG: copper chaperone PCu(A)C [Acidimicrobiia bacterium]